MKGLTTTKTALYGTLLAGLIGFSSAGLAQSNAIEALDHQDATNDATEAAQSYPEANQLATALDQYNRQDRDVRGLETHAPATTSHHVSRTARELASEIDAYYANAGAGRIPETHVPANESEQPTNPVAHQLAAELTRYNRKGGRLAD